MVKSGTFSRLNIGLFTFGLSLLAFAAVATAQTQMQQMGDKDMAEVTEASDESALPKVFQRFDRDQDNALSFDEFRTLRRVQFQRLDRDEDGALSRNEAGDRLSLSQRQDPTTLFGWYDTDFNGTLSRYEFVEGPIPALTRIDVDYDARLTPEELQRTDRQP